MNRRGFIGNLAKAVACFSILPAATTYARKWVMLDSGIATPHYEIITDWQTMAALDELHPFKLKWSVSDLQGNLLTGKQYEETIRGLIPDWKEPQLSQPWRRLDA